MKKIIQIMIIILTLVVTSTTTAYQCNQKDIQLLNYIKTRTNNLENENVPEWATGNFTGVWGISALGQPLPALGWVEGYYSDKLIARLEGEFAVANETNTSSFIKAIAFGPFLIGTVGNIETGNGTFIVGLGGVNETNFYWRLNLIIGPTFFMYGNYTKFEE